MKIFSNCDPLSNFLPTHWKDFDMVKDTYQFTYDPTQVMNLKFEIYIYIFSNIHETFPLDYSYFEVFFKNFHMCKMLSLKIQKLFDSFSNSGRKITGKNISLKTKFNYKVIKLLYS